MGTTQQTAALQPGARGLLTRALVFLIDIYRWLLSPLIGQHCRFHPTCSQYARGALLTHGPLRGSWLALRRLGRCHPWAPGGIDEVPQRSPSHTCTRPTPELDS